MDEAGSVGGNSSNASSSSAARRAELRRRLSEKASGSKVGYNAQPPRARSKASRSHAENSEGALPDQIDQPSTSTLALAEIPAATAASVSAAGGATHKPDQLADTDPRASPTRFATNFAFSPSVGVSMLPRLADAQVVGDGEITTSGTVPASFPRMHFTRPSEPEPLQELERPEGSVEVTLAAMMEDLGHGGLVPTASQIANCREFGVRPALGERNRTAVLGSPASPPYQEILAQARLEDWQLSSQAIGIRGRPWEMSQVSARPSPLPQFSYEALYRGRAGGAADEPDKAVRVGTFSQSLSNNFALYQHQSRNVEPQKFRPDYGSMIAAMEPDVDRAGDLLPDSRVQLSSALKENQKIREVLLRDAIRMRKAIPKAQKHTDSDDSADEEADEGVPEEARAFHKVKLTIQVLKCENLPDAHGMYSCDPYVKVNVVDGDPMTEEAEKPEWYSKHDQWSGETAHREGTQNPVFESRLTTSDSGIRARSTTYVHFRVYDHESISTEDSAIGQAVVHIDDVLKDLWHNVKPVALAPFRQKTRPAKEVQKDWMGLRHARLYTSIQWEGIGAAVGSKVAWGDTAAGSGAGRSRRDRRGGETPRGNKAGAQSPAASPKSRTAAAAPAAAAAASSSSGRPKRPKSAGPLRSY